MKHLKKILVAFTILALLVSSAVLVITAAGGSIEELEKQHERVETFDNLDGKTGQLARVYAYMAENPIDPATEGYAELVAEIHATSVDLANQLTALIGDTADPATSIQNLEALNAVFAHLESCPPADDTPGYQELAALLEQKNAEIIGALFEYTKVAPTEAKKQDTFVRIYNQFEYKPLDKDLYADLFKQCAEGAKALAQISLDKFNANLAGDADTTEKYFARVTSAGVLDYFLSNVDISKAEGAAAFLEAANEAIKQGKADKLAAQLALDSEANFDEYSWTDYRYNVTFDDGGSVNTINTNETNYSEIRTEKNGNKHYTLHYGSTASHLYTEPSIKTDEPGLVLNLDMKVSAGFFGCEFVAREPGIVMQTLFQIKGIAGSNNERTDEVYLEPANGASTAMDGSLNKVYGAIAPNVWFTLTITFDETERTGMVYVNYAPVLKITYHDTIKFGGLRIGKTSTDHEISIDNFDYYNGTSYRIFDKFEKMNDNQQFMYFVDYFTNEKYSATNRNAAYLKARELISTIPDSDEIASYKQRFADCNYEDEIKKPAMELNLKSIKELVALLPTSVTSENRFDVALQIEEIDEFIAKNNELINRADNSEGGYLDQVKIINAAKEAITRVINMENFVSTISKFYRATTKASMTKYATAAKAIYDLAGYADSVNVAYVENDVVVRDFEVILNGEEADPADKDNYLTAFEYYETFLDTIAVRARFENSKRIMDCLGYIVNMDGYEATEDFWGANVEYISKYVTIIRDVVSAGDYDTEYEGIDEALVLFADLDAFFYEALQQSHVAVFEQQLERFLETSSFIEKMGICTYLAGYLAENDIALYNPNLSDKVKAVVADEMATLETLIYVYETYSGELKLQEVDYANVLNQNTEYFINIVYAMDSVVTYKELRPYVTLASEYYYGMNVDSEEAKDAIEKYNGYLELVESIEADSADFVMIVEVIANIDEVSAEERASTLYEKLTEALALYPYVDENVEGVADAIAVFTAAVADYNANVNAVNADINDITKVSCAVRTGSVLFSALATIINIIKLG